MPQKADGFHFAFKAMGSPCQLWLQTDTAAQAHLLYQKCLARIRQLEQRYSRFRSNSLISRINQHAGSGKKTAIDHETFALLQYANQCYQESEGLFDITSGVLNHAWDFYHHNHQCYSTQMLTRIRRKLESLLPLVNWPAVEWNEHFVYLPQCGMQIDFGGLVKEYAADCVYSLCMRKVSGGFINMGGDIRLLNQTPLPQPLPIQITIPPVARASDKQRYRQVLINYGALASSGDYERYIIIGQRRYGHILNPQTGWPVTSLNAVSVIAPYCIMAGSMATISLLKGKHGIAWLQSSGARFLAWEGGRFSHNLLNGYC